MKKNIYIKTFGCQMNIADSQRMAGILQQGGFSLSNSENTADIVVLNTCSVRKLAEDKVWGKLGRLRKKGGKIVAVSGCMAQRYGKNIFKRAPYVNVVCGTYRFHNIGNLLKRASKGEKKVIDIEPIENDISSNGSYPQNTTITAWVPIMRGCNNACSYCVVPQVRGQERSRSIEEIINEITKLGCKEVTLLGQNVNSFQKNGFPGLLTAVNNINGLERIKFITSHPKDATLEMFRCIAQLDKVCEYLHLPIQSGSNRILQRMRRGYTREHYLDLINQLKQLVPDIAISTDIIVGFPGEQEEDFQATYELMKEVEHDNAFIFKYSPREGTAAADLPDDVPLDIKKKRNNCLLKLQDQINQKKNKCLNGRELEILVEGPSKNNKNRLMGRSRTNKIVVFEGPNELIGKLVKVKINDTTNYTLYGKV